MRRILPCIALLSLACTPAPAPPDLDAARREIMATDNAFLAAAATKNVDSIVSFWAADARVISPGEAPRIGTAALRQMVASSMNTPGFSVTWHIDTIIVANSGDLAYGIGTNRFTMPGAGGKIDTLRGQAFGIWRKEGDGRWRMVIDASTPQAP